jgi:hypothetical protein
MPRHVWTVDRKILPTCRACHQDYQGDGGYDELVAHLGEAHGFRERIPGEFSTIVRRRRLEPINPRTVAKESLTVAQVTTVLEASRRFLIEGRDPLWTYHTVATLAFLGCHTVTFRKIRSDSVVEKDFGPWSGWAVVFNRPKKKVSGASRCAVPFYEFDPIIQFDPMLPGWLPRFLDEPKPSGVAIWQQLQRLSVFVRAETGQDIHLNENRFRHSAMMRWKNIGLTPLQVADMLGTSVEVVTRFYMNEGLGEALVRISGQASVAPGPPDKSAGRASPSG